MTSQQAKEILLLYRPGTADADDSEVARALEVARRDPELGLWLEQHCARQSAIRASLRRIPVPEGLQQQIVSEVPAQISLSRRTRRVLLTAALTVVAVLVGLAVFFPRPPRGETFAAYRGRMVKFARRGYQMDLETNDLGVIRRYLANINAHGDAALPAGIAKGSQEVQPTGCAVLTWQAQPVSMLCFGKAGKTDLWLFVINRPALPDAPEDTVPHFKRVNTLMTASWSKEGKTYLLAGSGDQASLREFF